MSVTFSKWQKLEHWGENKDRRESKARISATRAAPAPGVEMDDGAMMEPRGTRHSLDIERVVAAGKFQNIGRHLL